MLLLAIVIACNRYRKLVALSAAKLKNHEVVKTAYNHDVKAIGLNRTGLRHQTIIQGSSLGHLISPLNNPSPFVPLVVVHSLNINDSAGVRVRVLIDNFLPDMPRSADVRLLV